MTSFRSPSGARNLARSISNPAQRSLSTTCQPQTAIHIRIWLQPYRNRTQITPASAARSSPSKPLLPTPVRLCIPTRRRQLLLITPIRQHRPDLLPTRSAGLKNNMPPIRRPRRKIISTPIMRQLHPLLAGRVHQVNIRCPRSTGPVMSSPREHQKLPIRRPCR